MAVIITLSKFIIKNSKFEKTENQEKAQSIINTFDKEENNLATNSSLYTIEIHEMITEISKDPVFKETFKIRETFHIFDGAEYFFSKLDQLSPPDYKPSYQDLLYSRRKTTGIYEVKFKNNTTHYKRKKKKK
jgi:hypothetical protein